MADYEGRYLHQQFGNYRLVKLLGYGGFAEVYLGEHIHMGTQTAVKVLTAKLTPEEIEHFRNEARTIFGLEHPNIVRVLDYGLNGNIPYIVMGYAANGSLRKRHPRGTRVPLPTVVEYVKQVAAALQYAHDEGLVHRDVKPHNMLIGKRNDILLSDFGIVTVSSSVNSEQSQAQTGTWTYMAPEQIMKRPIRASDQYALGITVYEWLCGRPPFEGDWYNLYHQHLNVAPQPLRERVSDIPTGVEQAVMKALAKGPENRYKSVQKFAEAFEEACKKPPVGTTLMMCKASDKALKRIVWSPDGTYIMSILEDGIIQIWNATTGIIQTTYHNQSKYSDSVMWFPDGKHIGSIGRDSTIEVWDAASGVVTLSYYAHEKEILAGTWSPDGRYFVFSSIDHSIQMWDAAVNKVAQIDDWATQVTGEQVRFLKLLMHLYYVNHIAWSSQGTYLAFACTDGFARDESIDEHFTHIDGFTMNIYHGATAIYFSDVKLMKWSPSSKYVAARGIYPFLYVWENSARIAAILPYVDGSSWFGRDHYVKEFAWSPDGRYIAGSYADNMIDVWDLNIEDTATVLDNGLAWILNQKGIKMKKRIAQYSTPMSRVNALAWSPEGKVIASGSDDHAVQIWEATTGKHFFTYRCHAGPVTNVAWSPDGQHIASCSEDGIVHVWQAV